MLVDTHCHLTSEVLFKNVDQVCQQARLNDVGAMVTVATHAQDACLGVSIATHIGGVYATIGVHPHEAAKVVESDWQTLAELRIHPKVIAWGEIGLDYHYEFSDRRTQQDIFATQLDLAKRAQLPVIIHCREAMNDTLALLEQHNMHGHRVVFHCYAGDRTALYRILDCGWWVSFTGIVTFQNSQDLQNVARDYPIDMLMLETDAPYLTPEPRRKIRPNEPKYIQHTAAFLADLRGMSLDELIDATTENASNFFGVDFVANK